MLWLIKGGNKVKCPFCGAENAESSNVCIYCGSQLPHKFEKEDLKFCRYCGNKIPNDAVICVYCGRQVEELKRQQEPQQYADKPVAPQVIIYTNEHPNEKADDQNKTIPIEKPNNYRQINKHIGKEKNKWVSIILCLFLGFFGGHKFYEEKIGMGILYLCTFGLFGFGVIIDLLVLLFKPNPYYIS